MEAVVKVGGSLAEDPSVLRAFCSELSHVAMNHSIVVVPGGGRFADLIREYNGKYGIQPAVSHRLSILAMDQYGLFLSQIIFKSNSFSLLEDAQQFSIENRVPIFLPSKFLFETNPFEPSWDVTSDSIAAFIAKKLRANKLVLVTDVDGVFNSDPKSNPTAKLLDKVSIDDLLERNERTSVDKYLPLVLRESNLDCYIINGHYPERITLILANERTRCTRIIRNIQ